MKKIVMVIVCLLVAVPLFPVDGDGLYVSLGFGYQFKSDRYFKEVYDNGAVNYTLDLGYWISKNVALGAKVSHLSKKGKTLLFQSGTRLRQTPVLGYLKGGLAIGKRVKGYVSLGMGYLFFKEESYIGEIEDGHFGWEIESGIEYSMLKRFYLLCAASWQSVKMTFPEFSETQQLGGTNIKIGIGIRL